MKTLGIGSEKRVGGVSQLSVFKQIQMGEQGGLGKCKRILSICLQMCGQGWNTVKHTNIALG